VDEDVFFDDLEVFHWVFGNVGCGVEVGPVPGGSVDLLADWDALLGLHDTGYCGDDTTDDVGDILVLVGRLELLVSSIKEKSGLIFVMDACEEGVKVEFASEWSDQALGNLSDLNFIVCFLNCLLSDKCLSSSLSNLETKVGPVLSLIVCNSGFDFSEDFSSVNDEVFANVVGK